MKTVTIYSNTGCGGCNAAKMFMTARKIPFVERNIAHDDEARDYLINVLGVSSVPVLEVEGKEHVVGFSPQVVMDLVKE